MHGHVSHELAFAHHDSEQSAMASSNHACSRAVRVELIGLPYACFRSVESGSRNTLYCVQPRLGNQQPALTKGYIVQDLASWEPRCHNGGAMNSQGRVCASAHAFKRGHKRLEVGRQREHVHIE